MAKKTTESAVPPGFADIMNARDFDPLEKYANIYLGVNPDQMVTITQAREFLPFLASLWVDRSPVMLDEPKIIAIQSGMQASVASSIPLDQLLADGFPVDKKAFLHYLIGEPEEGKYMGSARCVNAALAIRMYFSGNPDGLWENVKPL